MPRAMMHCNGRPRNRTKHEGVAIHIIMLRMNINIQCDSQNILIVTSICVESDYDNKNKNRHSHLNKAESRLKHRFGCSTSMFINRLCSSAKLWLLPMLKKTISDNCL
mmetsp:Transcript_120576/g.246442  ORF Transcript_120576/g.246442 Transcript_120576/m.246442 type:complete len:108 (-) Transcript_120576:587-910(-)